MTSNRNPVHYMQHPTNIALVLTPIDTSATGNPTLPLGLICNTDTPYASGEQIEISAPKQAPEMSIRGEIAWCRSTGAGHQVGVAFNKSDELYKIRMLEQLCHIEEYRRTHPSRNHPEKQGAALEWIEKFAAHFPTDGL
ncbi:PilZ domain-containing protein [Marinobacterium sp. YM272]|uniref:PilZ domain-containing protein n=1 Tax=Marinobacterium sp. YM272 TaxID=3421654 RepID=UPI003D7FEAE4